MASDTEVAVAAGLQEELNDLISAQHKTENSAISSCTNNSNAAASAVPASPLKVIKIPSAAVASPTRNAADQTGLSGVKRPLPPPSGKQQIIKKIIISQHPNTNKPVSTVVTRSPGGVISTTQGVSTNQVLQGSPVKLVTSDGKSYLITASPTKQVVAASAQANAATATASSQNKIALSPFKGTKVVAKALQVTPKKIAPAPALAQQMVLKQVPAPSSLTLHTNSTSIGPQSKSIIPGGSGGSQTVQQIKVPGSKFNYIRLVTTNLTAGANTSIQAKPSIVTKTVTASQPVKVTNVPLVPSQQLSKVGNQQRLIMPASAAPIRPAPPTSVSGLPPGTTLFTTTGPGNVLQNFAVVPTQFVTQLQQQSSGSSGGGSGGGGSSHYQPSQKQLPGQPAQGGHHSQGAAPASASTSLSSSVASKHPPEVNGSLQSAVDPRMRKPCNCTKSQCLKLYCDCFANGEFCSNCNCNNCFNNLEHESERSKSIKSCLDRNPHAFKPKIGKGKGGENDRRHNKGCNCKRSGCLKNYCECYEAKIMCTSNCKCIGCKNFEESPERKTLMHLADAAEVRVQQQTAAKSKLSSHIQELPTKPSITATTGERLPFSFVNQEVSDATCHCLVMAAQECERTNKAPIDAEKLVLEEFGRCLRQIIHSASQTKASL